MKAFAIRSLVIAWVVVMLLAPATIFFHNRGGLEVLTAGTLQANLQIIFPLFGLLAFSLITTQILLATNRWWLDAYWPGVLKFHRYEGMFVLLFAVLHPLSILIGFGLSAYWHKSFVSPALQIWLVPAYLGLTILMCTVVTAVLAWRFNKAKWWFKLHLLNYGVFALIWLHSWFIGSDIRSSGLRWLWLIYLFMVVGSVFARYWHRQNIRASV